MDFPIFKTKISGVNKKFDLNNPRDRKLYFEAKAGRDIKKLKDYFNKGNTFIAYLLGKKSSGKGTYAKMLAEIVGSDKIEHFSVGDMIRTVDYELKDSKKRKELVAFLKKNYRGWTSIEELMKALDSRSTKVLLPTELILTLAKREIAKSPKKTIFVDGFPRDLDQIGFTLFFRDLIGYRQDSDLFILIDVPDNVIDERIKYRRVCPICQTSRNYKLLPASTVEYDKKKGEFYLLCDNPDCKPVRMVAKEGDSAGIKPIKSRLKKDEYLIGQAEKLYGVPKIFLRNSIPANVSKKYVDDYEITPEYYYEWDEKKGEVNIKEKNWVVEDNNKRPSHSLLAAPVVVGLIKQLTKALDL